MDIDPEVEQLRNAIERIHGRTRLSQDAHGLHLYFPSPEAIIIDGEKELLGEPHASINVDMYLVRGKWANRNKATFNKDLAGVCHKYDKFYLVSDLLEMVPLADRPGIRAGMIPKVTRTMNVEEREKVCVKAKDFAGVEHLVPDNPGPESMVFPINSLEKGHPARQYLEDRNYDLDMLYQQFRCSYCAQETAVTNGNRRFYKRLPGGFRDTPAGRIIFYADVNGVQQGWQARIIDRVVGDGLLKQHFHPYKLDWVITHFRDSVKGDWQLMPELQAEVDSTLDERGIPKVSWKASKYLTGKGSLRSKLVMGYDAAIMWNLARGKTTAIVSEGPLDGGRVGPPGIAILGKFLNPDQAALLAAGFEKIVWIEDNDESGSQATKTVAQNLNGLKHRDKELEVVLLSAKSFLQEAPEGGEKLNCEGIREKGFKFAEHKHAVKHVSSKDLGDCTYERAWEILGPHIR
jgi:hypothetical protein